MNKKILIITYHFPPSQAVGGLRAANFARFLPRWGWQVQVLTILDKYIESSDMERLEGLEEVKIDKSRKLPKMMALYHVLKSLKNKIITTSGTNRPQQGVGAATAGPGAAEKSVTQRAKRYFASLFLALPDYEKNWILPATFKAIRMIRKNNINCILTSCPPYSVHLIGLLVHMATGVKWIADYRDPWYVASKKRMYPTCTLSRKIESILEKMVVRRASLVLCNTRRLRDTLAEAYSKVKGDGFHYIPNGISTDIFRRLEDLGHYEKFTITYTGSLYFLRTPEPIFLVLQELFGEKKLQKEDVVIKLIGHCETIEGTPTADIVASYGLESCVEVLPPVSYLESLKRVKKSHLALLLAPDQPYQIPAKVYDYIGTGTRILALAGEGATADIISGTETGNVFQPNDHQGLKSFLYEAITRRISLDEKITQKAIRQFDREKVVGDLAGCLATFFQEIGTN